MSSAMASDLALRSDSASRPKRSVKSAVMVSLLLTEHRDRTRHKRFDGGIQQAFLLRQIAVQEVLRQASGTHLAHAMRH